MLSLDMAHDVGYPDSCRFVWGCDERFGDRRERGRIPLTPIGQVCMKHKPASASRTPPGRALQQARWESSPADGGHRTQPDPAYPDARFINGQFLAILAAEERTSADAA